MRTSDWNAKPSAQNMMDDGHHIEELLLSSGESLSVLPVNVAHRQKATCESQISLYNLPSKMTRIMFSRLESEVAMPMAKIGSWGRCAVN